VNLAQTLLPIALVALSAAACAGTDVAGRSERVEMLYGGSGAYDLVAGNSRSGSIDAYKINGRDGATGDAGNGEISGYAIVGETAEVGDTHAAALGRILAHDATYLWDISKACEFRPGVAVRWERRSTTVDVLFCFSCDELEIYVDDDPVGGEDFDPRRAEILRIVKQLFAGDPEIQAIPE